MNDTSALSPLDGRYAGQVEAFARSFSEEALFRQRFAVEVEWLLALAADPDSPSWPRWRAEVAATSKAWVADLRARRGGPRSSSIERRINHDVKAVEYFLKENWRPSGCSARRRVRPFRLHLGGHQQHRPRPHAPRRAGQRPGCRSPTPWSTRCGRWPITHASLPMPATRTASPRRRPPSARSWPSSAPDGGASSGPSEPIPLLAKFNGAVGTYAAHVVAYPEVDWIRLSRRFVEGFGLTWNPLTTQIESHDALAEVFHAIVRFNSMLIDFCRDMWEYISRGYLRQRVVAGEVGSSTMPHKVNPIDFENAEANAGISTALLGPPGRQADDLPDAAGPVGLVRHPQHGSGPGHAAWLWPRPAGAWPGSAPTREVMAAEPRRASGRCWPRPSRR